MVRILMMSGKMVALGLLTIKLFWNKDYDVIICVSDVTNKILSRGSNFIIDVWSCDQSLVTLEFMWEKLL